MLRMVIQISFLAKDRQQCRTFQSVDLRQDGISLMMSCALRALELHSHLRCEPLNYTHTCVASP